MVRRLLQVPVALCLAAFYWVYSRLWRVEHVRRPRRVGAAAPIVWAHWHGDELLLLGCYPFSRMAVMASRSRDGEFMGWVLRLLGFQVARGSSSRGGAGGLKGLIDLVRGRGLDASLAVDGPRGPIYQVKPGILKLAQQTGAELVPGAAAAERRFVFKKAWNKCYLPLPFSRGVVVYGEPMRVPKGITDEEMEKLRRTLEQKLFALKQEAEARFVRTPEFTGV